MNPEPPSHPSVPHPSRLRPLRGLACALGLLAAGLTAGCFVIVQGSGVLRTEARQVPASRAVTLVGPIHAFVVVGHEPSVRVRCDDNLLPYVRTEVRGEELVIDLDHARAGGSIAPAAPCAVDVYAPSVESVAVTGSGDLKVLGSAVGLAQVRVTGSGTVDVAEAQSDALALSVTGSGDVQVGRVQARAVTLSTSGSGSVHIGGNTTSLRVDSSGSGGVDAVALAAERAEVDVSGSADVRIRASRAASVRASGSGDIHVAGAPPERVADASGSADIVFE